MNKKSNKYRKSILMIIFFILFLNFEPIFSCDEPHNDHDDEGDKCRGCQNQSLEIINSSIDFGDFFAGTTTTLSMPNQLEFVYIGDKRNTYNFSFIFTNTVNLTKGYAKIKKWTWEYADRLSQGVYSNSVENRTNGFEYISLYKPRGVNHCKSYAKFRLTAKELEISKDAIAGSIEFKIIFIVNTNM